MTTSRYVNSETWNGEIYMSDLDWMNFEISISHGCTFIRHNYSNQGTYRHTIPFILHLRFYVNINKDYYHITNDDRRKLVKYLGLN